MTKLYLFFYYVLMFPIYKLKFGKIGRRTRIKNPLRIDGFKNIHLGQNVLIQYKTWLASYPIDASKPCRLSIGENTIIGHFNHIYATKNITIGKNVLTADKVYISDNSHSFDDPTIPIMHQQIKQLNEVFIGDGSWIGENVCIIGASVGKHSIIGANSVVTKDIPDYSIAVGSPAIVIKQYSFEKKEWIKI
jgi:acetyltransferase-like isoleucine patch superfamily enzyme